MWLVQGKTRKLSSPARKALDRYQLRISPMVLLEVEYLYEIRRTIVDALRTHAKLQAELGVEICDYPFPKVAYAALGEKWTRDAFDRMIVAHAKANGMAPLITADELMHAHYPQAVW